MTKWLTPPLGSLVETIVPARDKPTSLDGPIPWVRIEDFGGKYISRSKSGQGVTPETIRSMPLRLFPAGTVVCTCSCSMGTTAIVTRPLVTNQTFIGLVPRPAGITSDFLYWLLQGHREQLTASADGAIQSYLSRDDFRSLRVPVPPIPTQRTIAAYLDRETSRIDALITAKKRMVELLDERWETVRVDLVTAADRVSETTHAGPRWLGDIPGDWTIERLKFLGRMDSGHTPDRKIEAYWVDCTIPWVTLNDVGKLQYEWTITETVNAINELGMANSTAHVLPKDTVILSRDATVGRTALLGQPMAVSQHFVGWICGPRMAPEYLLHVLRGPMQRHFATLTAGATIATIGMPELSDLVVPVPPINEQRRIIASIRHVEDGLNQTRTALTRQLALLQEHRQALITSAVVGDLGVQECA